MPRGTRWRSAMPTRDPIRWWASSRTCASYMSSARRLTRSTRSARTHSTRSTSLPRQTSASRRRTRSFVWTFPVGGKTYVFDTAKSTRSERRYYSNPFQLNMPQGCHVFWPALNLHLIGSTTAADVLYRLSSASRDDLGGPMVCERYTGWQDCGTLGYKRDGWLDVT